MAKSRWLDWEPGASIMENSQREKPTKPTNPGSVGLKVPFQARIPLFAEGAWMDIRSSA